MPLFPHVGKHKEQNILAAEFEVEYEEVFHLKELYKRCFQWFRTWNYDDLEGGDKPETLYFEQVNQAGGMQHHIWWRLQKTVNKYIRYFIKFDIQTLNMSKVEIMHKGKKAKTNKGDIIFRVQAYVMLDYQDEFADHPILKHFRPWFIRRWYRHEREDHKKRLWFEAYNLEEMIKQYLTLENATEMPEPFHPNKGLA